VVSAFELPLEHQPRVVVSHTVHGAVQSRIRACFEDIGEQSLKNIAAPVRAFRRFGCARTGTRSPLLARPFGSALNRP
jgi:class 3 adenylate cyclase